MNNESQAARYGSGKSVRRVEDDNLLTGAGIFADDVANPGEAQRRALPSCRAVAVTPAEYSRQN